MARNVRANKTNALSNGRMLCAVCGGLMIPAFHSRDLSLARPAQSRNVTYFNWAKLEESQKKKKKRKQMS